MSARSLGTLIAMAIFPMALVAQPILPTIDMHLHVRKADYMGPNPPPMCVPFATMPR